MKRKNGMDQYFSIVGIGASAGGFEALQRFLNVLPVGFNFAIVIIQHLSPKHKNLLPELLGSKRQSLEIREISNGLSVEAGCLYLSPPGFEVRIRDGIFFTSSHKEGLVHLPIDEFFASLAKAAGDRAVTVILSGTGSDGARGAGFVRASGGTVYVQDPGTAGFSAMPLAAIATGYADVVLPPEDIARELLKANGIGTAASNHIEQISPEEFDLFFTLLYEKAGARFNHYKKSVVTRRIRRRMYLHGLSSVKDYLNLLSSREPETASLASDLMIGVTSFFRDSLAWKVLNKEAVRRITEANSGGTVRVWTPASATGEEAYSIAMMLVHELGLAGTSRDVQVFATDLNEAALEKARAGRYPASIFEDVPSEYLKKYFTINDDGLYYNINKDIRERVIFAKQNVISDPPFSRLDLVICRNFLIYLDPEAQEKCINLFHYALVPDGYLFLGSAETIGKNSTLFESVGRKQCRLYRKIERKPGLRIPLSVLYTEEHETPRQLLSKPLIKAKKTEDSVQEFLIEEYTPAAIALDRNYDIIYHNGPTNRYLRHPRGASTNNAMELLPKSAADKVRSAVFKAIKDKKTVSVMASFPVNGDYPAKTKSAKQTEKEDTNAEDTELEPGRDIIMRVSVITNDLIVITFGENSGLEREKAAVQEELSHTEDSAIRQIENELSATRQELHGRIEQLKSLNEELQSSNEELQASNEELDTSREELQSLNEEMVIINSQLHEKIEEQTETNNDLNNFLSSTNIPTIFLDREFRVKRFTPAMHRLIMLLPSDVGRHIVDLSQEGLGPELIADGKAVIDSLVPIRKEMLIGGATYLRTVLPYRTSDDHIQGVVVTYSDINELKRTEEGLRRRNEEMAVLLDALPAYVWFGDAESRAITGNRLVNEMTQVAGNANVSQTMAAEGKAVYIRQLKEDGTEYKPDELPIQQAITTQRPVHDAYIDFRLPDGRRVETMGNAVPLFNKAGKVRGAIAAFFDVTERRKTEAELRESEERYREIVETTKEGIVTYKADGTIIYINQHMADMLGYSREEIIGKSSLDFVDDKEKEAVIQAQVRLEERGSFSTERGMCRKDGSVLWTLSNVTPRLDSAGNIIGYLAMHADITDRKRAEEALRKSREDLEQRVTERTVELRRRSEQLRAMAIQLTQAENRERKRIATILHDHLQQLLVGAKLGTETAARQSSENDLKNSIQKISELLDESIKVSRSLTADLSPPIIHEGGLVPGLKWLGRWIEEKQGFKVNVFADIDIPPDTEGISIILFQSIRELLLNAVKHSGEKEAEISVNIINDNMLEIMISDKGYGFDALQVESSGSDAGLGIFTIRERMDFLGGRMNIESAPGMGTRITLTAPLPKIPIKEKAQSRAVMADFHAGKARIAEAGGVRKIRVLVVDDHAIVREGFVQLISNEIDMEVVGEASNGEEAVDIACSVNPDVIIMDISMPKMNGIEATAKIVAEMPSIRIIGLSMYEKSDQEKAMMDAGASAFLTKDGPSKNLIEAIRAKVPR